MGTVRGALGDALSVVLTGLRLALAHLPVLLALFLLGSAGRNGVLWGAVAVSENHSTLAGFMLPFAPLSTLVAFVLMLRVVAASLPHAGFGVVQREGEDAGQTRAAARLQLLASTLIPFLTVYAAQGYLRQDVQVYVNAATFDEIFGNAGSFYGETANFDRTAIATGTWLVALVVIAFVLRWLLSRFDLPSRHLAFGAGAAYIEVLWLLALATQFTRYQDRVWQWFLDRRFTHGVQARWSDLVDVLGPVGQPLASAMRQVGSLIDSSDDILLIPIAWLTVGAVALGHTLSTPAREKRRRPWEPVVARVPPRVRGWGAELTSDVGSRFRGLADGVRLLAIGGLLPMLLFCVVFVLARQGGLAVGELWRLLVGPQEQSTGLAFAPWQDVLVSATYNILLVGLLAAAVDRVVMHAQERADAQAEGEVDPTSDASIGSST